MEFWIFVLIFYGPSLVENLNDPVDGWLAPDVVAQDLDCRSLSAAAGRVLAPGELPDPAARQDFLERRAVLCRERIMPNGSRRGQDDAVMFALARFSQDLAALVADEVPGGRERTWLVETFYPDAQVTQKLTFAAKNALHARGVAVSDRTPVLAAGDLEVLWNQSSAEAYPMACKRYASSGALSSKEALLAVVSRDLRSTILSAGVCVDGYWRWLQ